MTIHPPRMPAIPIRSPSPSCGNLRKTCTATSIWRTTSCSQKRNYWKTNCSATETDMAHTPIKRHKALQGVSREHHHGLLLCWKIRTGLAKNISPDRIKTYVDWFFDVYLRPHFELEENH